MRRSLCFGGWMCKWYAVRGGISGRGAVVGGAFEKGGVCFLYVLFVADLHSGLLCCIFAVAREVRGRFPFLDSHPPNGPPTP